MLKKVQELRQIVKKVKPKIMAVVFAHDEFVIKAVFDAVKLGVVKPVLIGIAEEIKSIINKQGVVGDYKIIDEPDPELATKIAMDMVNNGQADIVMKGLIDTKVLLKGVVNKEYGIRKAKLLSHVGIVSFPDFDRVLFATDGAMNILPTVEEKILIVENAVALAHSIGYENPLVGIVSSVEKVNPKIPSTVDTEAITKYYTENKPQGFTIDGPFAIDNLVSMDSVKHKGLSSPIAGKADILIFPDLDAGNIFYKTSVFLAQGISAGLVIGAKVPIVLTSRADSAEAKLYSILLAVVNQNGLLATSN